MRLSYYVRFSENFDFVKGGKLPGLFGGVGNSGGEIPDGTDGFSTRFMWRRNGDFKPQGSQYVASPVDSKRIIQPGRSRKIGFCADKLGADYQPRQVSVSVK
jgi:hypothetical protein